MDYSRMFDHGCGGGPGAQIHTCDLWGNPRGLFNLEKEPTCRQYGLRPSSLYVCLYSRW